MGDTDIAELITDMARFARLLDIVGFPESAAGCTGLAETLQEDASNSAISAAREWIKATFSGGMGGLRDRYVRKDDGSVDEPLNNEYEELCDKLVAFAYQA